MRRLPARSSRRGSSIWAWSPMQPRPPSSASSLSTTPRSGSERPTSGRTDRGARTLRLRDGEGLGERRRGDEREHEGKGRFHWFDLCLGHYWDTAAVRHWNRYAISARILLRHGTQGASQAPGVSRHDTPHGCSAEHPNVSRRSAHPSIRVSEVKLRTPDANAPRERDGLF